MKVSVGMIVAVVVLGVLAEGAPQSLWDRVKGAARDTYRFTKGAAQGTRDMARAYSDMRQANYKNSDKYFHARGNYDAARRGPGGAWAAGVISNTRERVDQLRGGTAAQSAADQAANRWGRNGGDPNRYRPKGLPSQYKK